MCSSGIPHGVRFLGRILRQLKVEDFCGRIDLETLAAIRCYGDERNFLYALTPRIILLWPRHIAKPMILLAAIERLRLRNIEVEIIDLITKSEPCQRQ